MSEVLKSIHSYPTPKTLVEAICVGLTLSGPLPDLPENIEVHVRDFLSQKFTTLNFEIARGVDPQDAAKKCWEQIIAKDGK